MVVSLNSRLESHEAEEEASADAAAGGAGAATIQGYLAHKKQPPPRNFHSERDRDVAVNRKQLETFQGPLPESQGQNLGLTVLYVPDSLDISERAARSCLSTPAITFGQSNVEI